MADNKKYYYLKLKDNFFDSDEMIILEAMPDGYLYSNILLKLYLRSLKNEGRLMFNNRIPFNSTMLAQVTRHSVGVIEKAMNIFKDLNLIEILDNGAIYISDIQNFIGESSTEADRKRIYRQKIESEKTNAYKAIGQMSDKCPDKSPPEIEIEIEIDIEKDIEKDIEIERESERENDAPKVLASTPQKTKKSKPKEPKNKYGEYANVMLTDTEIQKLTEQIPGYESILERLSEYIASTGKKYASHYATIRAWHRRDQEQGKPIAKQKGSAIDEFIKEMEGKQNGPTGFY